MYTISLAPPIFEQRNRAVRSREPNAHPWLERELPYDGTSFMKRVVGLVSLIIVLGLVIVAGWVRIPYYAIGPGPAREVEPLIEVHGHARYESSGRLIMTTIRFFQVTPLQALRAWLDPNWSLESSDSLLGGQTTAEERQLSLNEMDESKIDAAAVVLRRLAGYPKHHGDGALIERVFSGCPADGRLVAGEVISSIDGEPIASAADASKSFDAAPPGDPVSFEVRAEGRTRDVQLTRRTCAGSTQPVIGISIVDTFPFSIAISSGDIGGPSAGLMWALGLYDLLTRGDITGGRVIAGTGTIDLKGSVGPIGGIRDKVVAAEGAGANVFLVPAENMAELRGVDTGDMRLVSVSTFQDALDALNA